MTSLIDKETIKKAITEVLDQVWARDTPEGALLELASKLKIRLTGGWDNWEDFVPDWTPNLIYDWGWSKYSVPSLNGRGHNMHQVIQSPSSNSVVLETTPDGKFVMEFSYMGEKKFALELFDSIEFAMIEECEECGDEIDMTKVVPEYFEGLCTDCEFVYANR